MTLDISTNRNAKKYSRKELLLRVVWGFVQPLYRFSPKFCHRWRVFLLQLFGAKIGKKFYILPTAKVMYPWMLEVGEDSAVSFNVLIYNLGKVIIGDRVTISHGVHLCAGTHDFRDPAMPLQRLPIVIENDVWVCADAFVGPDVVLGDNSLIGARSVVVKDVNNGHIVAGNPAKTLSVRSS